MLDMQRVMAAAVRSAPFPHLIIDGVFESDFYSALVGAVPSAAQMRQYDPANRSSALSISELSHFDSERAADLQTAMVRLGEIVSAKFTDDLAKIWSGLFPDLQLSELWPQYQSIEVLDRGTGFSLRPHLDGAECLITILIYLPENDANRDHGTELYAAKPRWGFDRHLASLTREAEKVKLRLHTKVEYLPNRMLAFVNGPLSFHGNSQFQIPSRKFIQSHIRIHRPTFYKIYAPLKRLAKYPGAYSNEPELAALWGANV